MQESFVQRVWMLAGDIDESENTTCTTLMTSATVILGGPAMVLRRSTSSCAVTFDRWNALTCSMIGGPRRYGLITSQSCTVSSTVPASSRSVRVSYSAIIRRLRSFFRSSLLSERSVSRDSTRFCRARMCAMWSCKSAKRIRGGPRRNSTTSMTRERFSRGGSESTARRCMSSRGYTSPPLSAWMNSRASTPGGPARYSWTTLVVCWACQRSSVNVSFLCERSTLSAVSLARLLSRSLTCFWRPCTWDAVLKSSCFSAVILLLSATMSALSLLRRSICERSPARVRVRSAISILSLSCSAFGTVSADTILTMDRATGSGRCGGSSGGGVVEIHGDFPLYGELNGELMAISAFGFAAWEGGRHEE
mmetsp:Transcript_60714/g.144444  ORF Transcript_60714/g.144444 Transcript_60714/m.144444 type:complete len:364 (-) Transcript_60714:476-1567(-)